MNESEQNTQKQGKKIIKKYILHQKVNPRLLGVELLNKRLATPYEAYLSCKLLFKKDVQSLMELEQIAKKIYETWTEKNDQLLIKKINVFTSTAYIVLTFTIGFHEEKQVRLLPELKECAKELIETYDRLINEEKEAVYKKKEEEIHGVLEKFSQLTKKMDGLEDRLTKNESIVLDSGELLKTELTKVSQTIKEQMSLTKYNIKESRNYSEKQEKIETETDKSSVNTEIKTAKAKKINQNKVRSHTLDRTKQLPGNLQIKEWTSDQLPQKEESTERVEPTGKTELEGYVSKLELKILDCFTENKELNKKRMVQKKQFLILKTKVEFIDYLWMLLELEGKDEIIIASKLSCRELVEQLGQFMELVEKVATGPTIFSYWVYCPQDMLVKLEGYAALKDILNNSLKLSNNKLINES